MPAADVGEHSGRSARRLVSFRAAACVSKACPQAGPHPGLPLGSPPCGGEKGVGGALGGMGADWRLSVGLPAEPGCAARLRLVRPGGRRCVDGLRLMEGIGVVAIRGFVGDRPFARGLALVRGLARRAGLCRTAAAGAPWRAAKRAGVGGLVWSGRADDGVDFDLDAHAWVGEAGFDHRRRGAGGGEGRSQGRPAGREVGGVGQDVTHANHVAKR